MYEGEDVCPKTIQTAEQLWFSFRVVLRIPAMISNPADVSTRCTGLLQLTPLP